MKPVVKRHCPDEIISKLSSEISSKLFLICRICISVYAWRLANLCLLLEVSVMFEYSACWVPPPSSGRDGREWELGKCAMFCWRLKWAEGLEERLCRASTSSIVLHQSSNYWSYNWSCLLTSKNQLHWRSTIRKTQCTTCCAAELCGTGNKKRSSFLGGLCYQRHSCIVLYCMLPFCPRYKIMMSVFLPTQNNYVKILLNFFCIYCSIIHGPRG